MLDIIRKKAASLAIKIIFGAVIVVFIFFFGYNRISQRYRGQTGGIVATVNGASIAGAEFRLAYDNTYQMYQQIFKGKENEPLSPEIEKSVRASTLRQLIQQKTVEEFGHRLGVEPAKLELADFIRSSPVAKGEDGQFDPYIYKQRFLPYFSQKFNLNYEKLVENDLLLKNVNSIFASASKAPFAKAMYDMENTRWSFIVTSDGTSNKAGPITINERGQIFQGEPPADVWQKVFSLAPNTTTEPIEVGGKLYTVRLVKKELPKNWEKDKAEFIKNISSQNEQQFTQIWMGSLMKDAKIKTFIEE